MDHPPSRTNPARPTSGRVLVISSVRWGYLWQRHQALATAAAADGWQVDFLEPHPRNLRQIASFVAGRLRGTGPFSRPAPVPIGVQVLPVASWLRPGRRDYDLVVCYVPDARSLRRATRARGLIVYDAVLDWAAVPASWYPPPGWRRAEGRLARRSAAVTTDSAGTRRILASRGIEATVLHPAADDAFLDPDLPAAAPGTAVYFGAVRSEVDHEALLAVAGAGFEVDVWGPVEDVAVADLLRRGGVRLHEPLPIAELAPLVAQHQLVLLPYRGARGDSLMPAKFWNCLAIGRWVLASGIDLPSDDLPAVVPVSGDTGMWRTVAASLRDRPDPRPPTAAPTWTQRWRELVTLIAVDGT